MQQKLNNCCYLPFAAIVSGKKAILLYGRAALVDRVDRVRPSLFSPLPISNGQFQDKAANFNM